MVNGIPKLGKHISVTTIVEKYKVVGGIARALLRALHKNGRLQTIISLKLYDHTISLPLVDSNNSKAYEYSYNLFFSQYKYKKH